MKKYIHIYMGQNFMEVPFTQKFWDKLENDKDNTQYFYEIVEK